MDPHVWIPYFQGGVIRQELFYLLKKDEKDVHFTFGSIQRGGVNNVT